METPRLNITTTGPVLAAIPAILKTFLPNYDASAIEAKLAKIRVVEDIKGAVGVKLDDPAGPSEVIIGYDIPATTVPK